MRSRYLAPLGGALLAVLMASAASAAEPNGWYSAWDIGAHWDASNNLVSTNTKPNGITAKWKMRDKTDWAGFARLGYRFDPHWRGELELGYRNGALNRVLGKGVVGSSAEPIGICNVASITATTCGQPPRGYADQWTGMANLIYDFFPDSSFHPFVGAGVGVDYNKSHVGGVIRTPTGGDFIHLKDDKAHFAWQLIGGDTFDLSPQWALDLTYRFLQSNQSYTSRDVAIGGSTALALGDFHRKMTDHTVTVGFRYMWTPPTWDLL